MNLKNIVLTLFLSSVTFSLFGMEKKVRVALFSSDVPALSSLHISFDPDSYSVITQIHDSLIHNDLDGKMQPGLAVSWKQTNPVTFEFLLRKGVKFHDGSEFSAKDVKFTYETILDPKIKSGTYWVLGTIKSVEILNEYKIRIITKHPDGMLLHRLTMFGVISSKTYVEKVGLKKAIEHPVGTGPFKFVKHEKGKEYVLKANTSYWRAGIPAYDKLVFKIIPEKEWPKALLAGEVDLVPLLSGLAAHTIRQDNIAIYKRLVLQQYWVLLKNKGPLADVRVRKALNYALNKKQMLVYVDMAQGEVRASLGKKGEFGYNPELVPRRYNLEKAKTLLKDAGFDKGFTIAALASDLCADVAKYIKLSLEEIGVKVDLSIVSRAKWVNTIIVGKIKGNPYQGDMAINLVDNPIVNQAFHSGLFLHSASPWSLLNDPEFDKKYSHAMKAPNMKEHERRLKNLDKYIYDKALLLFTYQKIQTIGTNRRIAMPGISINGHVDFYMLSDIKVH